MAPIWRASSPATTGPDDGLPGRGPGAHIVNLEGGRTHGAVDVSQVIAAIDSAVQHRNDPGLNIRVLALSYGTESSRTSVDPLTLAVEAAWRNGIVVVVAGGNEVHPSVLIDPATDPYRSLSCRRPRRHLTSHDDAVPGFRAAAARARRLSRGSRRVDRQPSCPGTEHRPSHPGAVVEERYFRGSGTSQATAVVAGAAALLLDARPHLTPDMVKAILRTQPYPSPALDPRARCRAHQCRAASCTSALARDRQSWPRRPARGRSRWPVAASTSPTKASS